MQIREIHAKSVLSRSQVLEYTVNTYVGCAHGCAYCYAKFMKRFTGHHEEWGAFVDVKVNAPGLLAKEIAKKSPGRVWVSGVCDAYQPLERKYQITRKCIEVLVKNGWPVRVQTKSPLVLRDLDILKQGEDIEVGFTITTADERMRRIFEPGAPPIAKRIEALEQLHAEGIRTFVMIAPLLPGAEKLPDLLKDSAENVLIDRLNYHYADAIYKKHGMHWALKDSFYREKGEGLRKAFARSGMPCQVLF